MGQCVVRVVVLGISFINNGQTKRDQRGRLVGIRLECGAG